MSDSAPPVPAWYPDPAREGQLRWWDGTGWTAQVREAVSAAPTTWSPEQEWSAQPKIQDWRPAETTPDPKYQGEEQVREWRTNKVASGALVLGAVNVAVLALALFSDILPEIRYIVIGIGVVASIVALRQAMRVEVGLAKSLIALALNLGVGIIAVVMWAQALTSAGAQLGDELGDQLDTITNYPRIVETSIQERAALDFGRGATDVVCPDEMDRVAGARYSCSVTLTDGSTHTLLVEITDADGGFTYEIAN